MKAECSKAEFWWYFIANSEEIQRAREVMEITRAEEISCSEEMLSERKSAA